MEHVDLEAALQAARSGDDAAMAQVFRSLHPALLQYVRVRAPYADVDDLVAETWLAAAEKFGSFAGGVADFRAWIFTIAHRRVIDYYRRGGRRLRPFVLEDAPEPAVPDVADAVVAGMSSDQAIGRLVAGLPPDQAEVLVLRVVGELGVEQAAAIMGKRPGAIRVLQHRALRRLRSSMSEAETGDRDVPDRGGPRLGGRRSPG
ncbi:MAG: RNA polymerase sigma factor [Actinomycetota bacterium]|nr:RNA polymerase sigma factor [Actinomycetota bacterium]